MSSDSLNYRPILLAVAVATAGVLPAFLTGGLAVQIRSEMHFGTGALGLLVAAFFASSALASALFGRLVERIGSHRGMRAAALASAASLLCVALLARSWGGLLFCLIFGGFANAVSQPATHLLLAREVPPERQGLSFGIKQAAIPTATLLAGLAVPIVAVTVGWRWAFAGGAALALMVALLVPAETITHDGVRQTNKGRAGDVHTRPLVLLAVGLGLGSTAATPLGAFISGAAVSEGMRAGTAGLLLALGSATGITVRVLAGTLADRMNSGRLRLVSGMLVVGAVGFALLASGIHGLLVVGTLLAFGAGWGWPGLFNFAIVRTNPGAPAAATGITQTGASSGAAVGPLIFGFLVEATSYDTAWLVSGAIAVAAAGTILAGRSMLVRDQAKQAR